MSEEFVISGWFDYAEHRDVVLAAFADCARASRAEEGCLDYWVAADPDESTRLYVFERWRNETDLLEHFRMPHIADFRAAIADYPRVSREVRRHFVDRTEEFQSPKVS